MTGDDVARALERLPELVAADRNLVRRGRFLSLVFAAGCPGLEVLLTVREGAVAAAERGPMTMRSWRFCVRAAPEAWRRFWQPVPEPGFNDLLAMTRFGAASIEGDLHPAMANLRYFKEVLEAPRRAGIGGAAGERADGG